MLANVKCGYVYIISNASLGKDIYKIGVTKRDFDVRIDELSNASVPFLFKANCILYSDDCFALESALHKEFEQYKVNKINPRKEFFKIPLDKIEEVVHNKYDANAIFNYSSVDDNFYASGYKICENFIDME